jgi:hypothetical protein
MAGRISSVDRLMLRFWGSADFALKISEKRNLAALPVLIQYSDNSFHRHMNHVPDLPRFAQRLYVSPRNTLSFGAAE